MRQLETRFRQQAAQCGTYGSALMDALLTGAADDLAAGGVVAELMAPHAEDPNGSVPSLRFAGALHRLVLERRAPELALHYPSVGGGAPVEDVWPAAERACREHLDPLRELVTHPVQTNEVGRAVVLHGALQLIGGPVRLLEIGASAGLNLRCEDGPGFTIVERRGCDPRPIDPTTAEGRLTLTSYVWADQVERLERLRAALEVAGRIPAQVDAMGALEFLTRELAEPAAGVTTVVWHSVVWQYMDPAERDAVDRLLASRGSLATQAAPLARVSLEPERVGGGEYVFQVHLQRWPGGERVHVADAHGHGPPVRWLSGRLEP